MTLRKTLALAVAGLIALAAPANAGMRVNGMRSNGLGWNGMPANGLPQNHEAAGPEDGSPALGDLNGVAIEAVTLPGALER
jgi:hypothetical protein